VLPVYRINRIVVFAGLEFAGLENDKLENDGRSRRGGMTRANVGYVLHTMK